MTVTALALAVIGTALIIALTAIAVGVLDHDREADTGLAADWDTHVAQALDLSRQEVAR